MADLKTSQFGTITAAQAESAGTEGYLPYVDPSQVDPDLRNKRMIRSEAKKFFGLQIFTALSGTSWDGTNKTLTLTSNTALTFSTTKRNGILRIKQDGTGGRTLTINAVTVPVADGANDITVVTFFYDDVAGSYVFSYEINILGNISSIGGGGDTTPPTVLSGDVIDATHFTVVFSETVVPTAAGWQVHDTVTSINYSPASVTGSGNTWTFALGSGSMPAGNALTLAYDSSTGNTVDASSNELVSFSGFAIANTSGLVDIDFTSVTGVTESPSNVWNGTLTGAGYQNTGLATLFLDSADDGYVECQYVASDAESAVFGFSPTNSQASYPSIQAAMSIYLGEIYKDDNGTISNTTVTIAVGNWLRMNVVGSVIKIQKSTDHVSWTDVATLGYTRTTDLHVVCNIDQTAKIYYPKGSNLS